MGGVGGQRRGRRRSRCWRSAVAPRPSSTPAQPACACRPRAPAVVAPGSCWTAPPQSPPPRPRPWRRRWPPPPPAWQARRAPPAWALPPWAPQPPPRRAWRAQPPWARWPPRRRAWWERRPLRRPWARAPRRRTQQPPSWRGRGPRPQGRRARAPRRPRQRRCLQGWEEGGESGERGVGRDASSARMRAPAPAGDTPKLLQKAYRGAAPAAPPPGRPPGRAPDAPAANGREVAAT